jgi:hypothetical protein
MGPMFDRLDQKITTLLSQYANAQSADKYIAVCRAALSVDRNAQLVGYRSNSKFLSQLSTWASILVDEYLRRLREEHNYKTFSTVLDLSRQAQLLGASNNTSETLDKLEKAMVFELEIKVNIQLPKAPKQTGINYQIDGLVKNIRFSFSDLQWHHDDVEFTMTSGTMNGDDQDQKLEGTYVSPKKYSADLIFDYKPCADSIEVLIDKFGPDNEVWSITTDDYHDDKPEQTDVTPPAPSLANGFIPGAFYTKIKPMPPYPGYFDFTPTPMNNTSTVFDEIYNSVLPGTFPGNITLKLTHKPQ